VLYIHCLPVHLQAPWRGGPAERVPGPSPMVASAQLTALAGVAQAAGPCGRAVGGVWMGGPRRVRTSHGVSVFGAWHGRACWFKRRPAKQLRAPLIAALALNVSPLIGSGLGWAGLLAPAPGVATAVGGTLIMAATLTVTAAAYQRQGREVKADVEWGGKEMTSPRSPLAFVAGSDGRPRDEGM
jgi:hypothetical protein